MLENGSSQISYDNAAGPIALFRFEASGRIGNGHAVRCLALAEALDIAGWQIIVATSQDSVDSLPMLATGNHRLIQLQSDRIASLDEIVAALSGKAELMIIDHYALGAEYETRCRKIANKIVVIEDLPTRQHSADYILDATPSHNEALYDLLILNSAKVLAGPNYALLRGRFRALRQTSLKRRIKAGTLQHILISVGATDPLDLTTQILMAIADDFGGEITVVLGAAAPHLAKVRDTIRTLKRSVRLEIATDKMAELMTAADLAIAASGTATFERCALGLPSVAYRVADNQCDIYKALEAEDAIIGLGAAPDFDPEKLCDILKLLQNSPKILMNLSRQAASLVDGRGATRAVLAMLPDVIAAGGSVVRLRLIEEDEKNLLLEWRSLPESRHFARKPDAPSAAEHDAWFFARLADPSSWVMIIEHAGDPVGMVRLDRYTHHTERLHYPAAEVSILVAPSSYRKGIAQAALEAAAMAMPGVELIAEILPDNIASQNLFARAGYIPKGKGIYSLPPFYARQQMRNADAAD